MYRNKKVFVYLLDLSPPALAHLPNRAALFSSPALQREAAVFGLWLQTGATWGKRALDSQLVRICDKFTF